MRLISFVLLLVTAGLGYAGLSVSRAQISLSEGGRPLPAWYEFGPGDRVFFSFFISGFQSKGEENTVALAYDVRAEDPRGTLIAPPSSGKIEVELAPEDKEWQPPVRYQITVPQAPLSGKYSFKVHVQDLVAGHDFRTQVPFEVKSGLQEQQEKLAIQDFGFYRSESDGKPIPGPAVFRAGEPIWARFFLTGYQFGPKNRYDVQYGLQVRDSSGRVVFEEPRAAAESEESFYPKHRVPGVVAVTLDRRNQPGDYVMTITAADTIGGQQATAEFPFRLQ